MKFSTKALLTAVACLAPVVSQAAPVAVTSNPSLSINGLNFSNFGCSLTMGGKAATPSSCDQINVGTITNPGAGIAFTSGFTASHNSFDDAVLSYNVSSATGISAVGLDFNGTFAGWGISSVTETIFSDGKQVGFAKVSCNLESDGCSYTDSISLNGVYNNLSIQKDINVTGVQGKAQISYVDQTFTATPEPGSTALLGTGLLGVAGLLRRRSIRGKKQA